MTSTCDNGFYMPFPEIGPSKALPEATTALWEWIDRIGLYPSAESRAHMERTRPDLLMALYYPGAGPEHLALVAQYTAFAFAVDDGMDDGPTGRDPHRSERAVRELIAVIDGKPPADPVTRALADLWPRINAGRSASWQASFRKNVTEWWWSYYAEAVEKSCAHRPLLCEYHEHRRKTFALYMYLDMCEIVAGVDLPERVRRLLPVLNLRNTVSEHGYFINDLISCPKEAALGYRHNAVGIAEHEYGLPHRQAVEKITALADQRALRTERLLTTLPAHLDAAGVTPALRDETLNIAESYRDQLRGNFDYHVHAQRHHVRRYVVEQSSTEAAVRMASLFA
ncbi:terpene cyclase [Streptomyces sp. NPDC050504]|uniref:terpene synthase family protein n=1 Tax=Streptomyces sp. NPDC050504 TaxID=3365618 RepID=UPI0037B92D85